ncbi:LytTR family DNA-binding domain-containing protein [Photobacterium toruni]|uniref:LytTR family DNA-binding domain-containing protein n=1 Tax=Photobacterium toruni TaxID=1935446 RepID=UPI0021109EC0|nr:LytTR family DNA-binding domain-containing protein [Photobacterium toruni]
MQFKSKVSLSIIVLLYSIVIFFCVGVSIYLFEQGHSLEKDFLDKMAYLFNNSVIVKEDLYLNDTAGLNDELAYIIESIKYDNHLESICGEISLTKMDVEPYNYIRCSGDDDYEIILNKQPRTYSYPIKLGDKIFGHLTWRIVDDCDFLSINYIIIYVLFVFSSFICGLLIYFYLSPYVIVNKNIRLNERRSKKDYEDIVCRVSQTLYMINNSASGGNKKYFPLNDDVVYVEYKNAYSTIHYVNGKTIMLRVSLSEIEGCIYNYFVRIKRNVLVNKYQISKCGKIESSYGNKVKLIVSLKNRKKEFDITNEKGRIELSDHIQLRKN